MDAASWLAGFIDGEGCVCITKNPVTGNDRCRVVKVANTDYGLIQTCVEALSELGITSNIHARMSRPELHHKPCWEVAIYGRANLERLNEMVPLQSHDKARKLAIAVASYSPNYVGPKPRPLRGEVVDLYERQQLSPKMIADRYGVHQSTVRKWLRFFGIRARSMSEAQQLRHTRAAL